MIIMLAPDEYLIAGSGFLVTFGCIKNDGSQVGIGTLEEGEYMQGVWKAGRRMNGDQDHQGRHVYMPGDQYGLQKVKLYTYR
jgi:hypothetical protein